MHRILLLSIFLYVSGAAFSQVQNDSLPANDSVLRPLVPFAGDTLENDSVNTFPSSDSLPSVQDSINKNDTMTIEKIIPEREIRKEGDPKLFSGKEMIFYTIVFLLMAFGIMRRIFSKYFTDLARIFFRRTLKQRQVYELLIQAPLPSVLLNLFFVINGGLYLSFLLVYLEAMIAENFWTQFYYCSGGLAAIYIVKFGSLKLMGWIFNIKAIINDYIFIVFMINKAIGVFLLPCIMVIAFSADDIIPVAFFASWFGIGFLFLYRLILSFGVIRNQVKVNLFHFLLYVVAFEFIPLMLIYKWLLRYF